jgi:hypothetical protein
MRLVAAVVSVTAVVAAAVALGLFLWLRTYAPLEASKPVTPGPGLGADVEPTFGSGGKTVLIPAYRKGRPFDTTFTLRNSGRFAVTLLGVGGGDGPLAPSLGSPQLRLDPDDTALVTIRWALDCSHAPDQVSSDHVPLRYRYLSIFRRTESVALPFAVTLRCSGGPPASP